MNFSELILFTAANENETELRILSSFAEMMDRESGQMIEREEANGILNKVSIEKTGCRID